MRYTAEERSADFAALQEAASPAELHHALVMGWPAAFGNEASWPIELLRRVHGTDSDGVGETVALLATDPRWKSVKGADGSVGGS